MFKISCVDRICNDVVTKISKEREVLFTLKKRKLEYFGHILRNDKYVLLKLIVWKKQGIGEEYRS